MSGASDVTHLQGGPEDNFQDVVPTGHAQTESSYNQIVTPPRIQFPATPNTAMQLENIPCAKVTIQNPLGNDPICVGGIAEQSPYIDLNYVGDFRGELLYEGMVGTYYMRNANRLSVVGTPLQSFTYKAYVNVKQKIITSTESPPNPDTVGPQVLFSDPADESTGILISRVDFTITMDEPILLSSINSGNVTITPTIDYDIFPDPLNTSRIRIALLEELAFGTEYTITIVEGGLKDLSENTVEADVLIQFTTEAAPPPPPPPDVTAPTVQGTNPIDNATSVPRDKIVTIDMSEAILASSVTTSTVTITPAIDYSVFVNPVNTSQIVLNHSVFFTYSATYTITLTSGGVKDLAGNGIAAPSVFDFTIEVQPSTPDVGAPTVLAIDPINGATGVVRDKTVTITMSEPISEASITTTNIVLAPTVAYTVFIDPTDSTKIKLDPSATLSGSALHTISFIAGGVKDLSENGIAAQSFTFTTEADPPPPDVTPPTITNRSPDSGASNVLVGSDIVVDFSEPLLTPIPANSFELFAPGPTEVTAVTITLENNNSRLRMNPTSNLTAGTAYTIFVRNTIEDAAGNNLTTTTDWTFTTAAAPPPVDTTAPTIIAKTPAAGATNVNPTTATVIIDFSEPIDTATVHANSVELFIDGGFEVPCTISFSSISGQSNRRVTLTPNTALAFNTTYRAFVRTTVKDVVGNAIALEENWTFQTTIQLSVVSRTPASSASNIAVNTNIIVAFNRAINTATVTSSTFELFNVATGVKVSPVIFTFQSGNTQVTMNPTPDLALSTQYQMIVRSNVADTLGVTLGSDDSWFFNTVVLFDISNRSPGVDETNVPIGSSIIIDFNKALNTSTITSNTIELFDMSTSPASEKTLNRTISFGNTRVTATPTTPLVYSRQYAMVVRAGTAGVKASDGSLMPAEKVWFFTTENDPVLIEQVYNVSGTGGDWFEFGNVSSSDDRQGRGLKITSNTVGVVNALHNVRPTNVSCFIRRVGNFTSPQDDDTIYCRIRSSTGTLRATVGVHTGALSITTGSSGVKIFFTNSSQSYKMVEGDCLLIEYDDGDDDEHFELLNVAGGPSAYSQEVYREADGTLVTTSKDMVGIVDGQRM